MGAGVRIHWKITKLPSQHSMTASKTPFKWRFTSRPTMAPAFSGTWILSAPYQLKYKKKNVFGVELPHPPPPPLTKLSGSAHDIIVPIEYAYTTFACTSITRYFAWAFKYFDAVGYNFAESLYRQSIGGSPMMCQIIFH